jgi:hypothetical protein
MTVHPDQLALDFAQAACLLEQLRDRRRVDAGPARLLAALVRFGLSERAVPVAAALALELDQPYRGDVPARLANGGDEA